LEAKTALMCRAMKLPGEDFDSFYRAAVAQLDKLEITRDFETLGVAEERVGEIARKVHTDATSATNPVPATVAGIESLLRQAIRKTR
jgi:alcohol dehydrogenase class IV